MANYSIKFGKRKIKNPFIHGKWMKREEVKSLGTLNINEYINELRKLESWTGNIHESSRTIGRVTND